MNKPSHPISVSSFLFRSWLVGLLLATTSPTSQAGTLMRPNGAGSTSSSTSSASASEVTAAQAAALAQRSQAVLLRSNSVQKSIQAMQAAARAAAQSASSTVPNGLVTGGLQVATGVPANLSNVQSGEDASLWQGAQLPTQTTDANGNTEVTIQQTSQQAMLTWQTYNIGKNTTLTYDQTAGGTSQRQWVVFNKVYDPSGRPSQILGTIKATGQVYVINQNGIIFGGSSQVNVHTLVASSLPINDSLVSRGLLNNPDTQFLFTALSQSGGNNGPTDAFTPPTPLTSDGRTGDVVVEAGAQLTSPTNSDKSGGRIALIGANVDNKGTISTPDGQTILAAGLQVGMAAHDTNDASLRGLDVYVGDVGTYAGTATNTGIIDAPRASVIMTGKSVNQMGVIASTTSASLNGRIDLLADYNAVGSGGYDNLPAFFCQTTGSVTFGESSITQILPEWSSTERVVGTSLAYASQINVSALTVYLAPQSLIYAPGANLTMQAGNWNFVSSGESSEDTFVYTDGQIYIDQGATIDVSGSTDVAASVTDNIISVQLLGAQLADSPTQRKGALYGKTIQIDIRNTGTTNGTDWVGTPLADTSGYVALVDHTVGQLTTNGGTVNLTAGGSVVVQSNASINVSGGTTDYEGGTVSTTKVISGGHIYDISKATADLVYSGVYTGNTGTYEAGYIQGGNAGSIAITAPAMALDGGLYGNTVAGPRQRTTSPTLGGLNLTFQNDYFSTATQILQQSPTPPAISFQSTNTLSAADAFTVDSSGNPAPLRSDRAAELVLAPSIFSEAGFGKVSIDNSEGSITVPVGSALTLKPQSSLTLKASNITIADSISAAGGTLDFTAYNVSPYFDTTSGATPAVTAGRGGFTLGAGATLSTAGLIVNDLAGSSTAGTQPFATTGGSISISAYDIALGAGSTLDVSGGVAIGSTGKCSYGAGGSLSIKAGQDPKIASVLGGSLTFDYTQTSLEGFSGGKGGSLTLQASLVQVGGASLQEGSTSGNTLWINPTATDGTLLADDFFSTGGFASFTLTGLGVSSVSSNQYIPAVRIANDSMVAPVVYSVIATPDATSDYGYSLQQILKPVGVRSAANLTFNAAGVNDEYNKNDPVRGDLVIGDNARIITDPKGSITLTGDTVDVLGEVIAPGGSIKVKGASNSSKLFYTSNNVINADAALPTVVLGSESLLSTAGTTLLTPDTSGHGYRTGSVLDGGTVSVAGNIVALAGSVVDVSGTSGVLDLNRSYTTGGSTSVGSNLLVPTRINSAGGSISFSGGQELFLDATLKAAAGTGTALAGESGGAAGAGGSLSVSSGFYTSSSSTAATTPLDVTLVVTQSGSVLPNYAAGQASIGQAVLSSADTAAVGRGYVAADTLNQGGFDSLTLAGTVEFDGAVNLAVNRSIKLATSGVILANNAVTLTASTVALGTALQGPSLSGEVLSAFTDSSNQAAYFAPTHGTGSLTVSALTVIDVGNLSLQGIGTADFTTAGDIRGSGTFDIAGALTLRAGQVYAPTATTFTIAAYDYLNGTATQAGSIAVEANGTRTLPYSAGSTLNLYASIIQQGGTLRAPFGTINLGWDGTGTAPVDAITGQAVAASSQITLASGSITSVSALDPTTGKALTLPYGLNLNGTAWIDPSGKNITTSGAPDKKVVISGQSVTTEAGATVDINGGGDLYAYRFSSGNGGSTDVLNTNGSFAVIPGYAADYAPFAPYNTSTTAAANLGSDTGYTSTGLSVGDKIYLDGSTGLPAGVYTLLPARYALLDGAFLVTPKSGVPTAAAATQSDGASTVAGYRFNVGTEMSSNANPLRSSFEVASSAVVRNRAQYYDSSANDFFATSASATRTPVDAGQLVLSATQAMRLLGGINAHASSGSLGGLIDISSPVDIVIGTSTTVVAANQLLLDASELSTYSGASLLIGGVRSTDSNGTSVTVNTQNLTLDNAGSPLSGADIVLVAKKNIAFSDGADLRQSGTLGGSATSLLLGSSSTSGSGDGVLVRVSSDTAESISRAGVSANSTATLSLGHGVNITGGPSLILDSTGTTSLASDITFSGQSITLDAGRISLQLNNAGQLNDENDAGLVLTNAALAALQNSSSALSLLSYSSIDIYGTGQVGTPSFSSLSLHSPSIRGFNTDGGTVTFSAKTILLDGGVGGTAPSASGVANGTLAFTATDTITLGANQLSVGQYDTLSLAASDGIRVSGTGGLTASGNLTFTTPVLTGAIGAVQEITSGGAFVLNAPTTTATSAIDGGLGASLTLQGASLAIDSNITLHSGALTLQATAGDILVGSAATSTLDVGGISKTFNSQTQFTDGGTITLAADAGSVVISAGSSLSVSAQTGGGDAGMLFVNVPNGSFSLNGNLYGLAGTNGEGGTFTMDTASVTGDGLAGLQTALNTAGFTLARDFRVRTGDVVVAGSATTKDFTLSADQGSITVTGTIDASGTTGGSIKLSASGSLTLASGASLTVAAQDFDNAGKGGAITLEAGSQINGSVNQNAYLNLQTGATIDLSVASLTDSSASLGDYSGTLHLRAPQNISASDLNINALDSTILGASGIVAEGYKLFDLTSSGGAITTTVQTSVKTNGTAFGGNINVISARLLADNSALASVLHVQPGAEIINRTGDLTLSTSWDLSGYRFGSGVDSSVLGSGEAGNLTLRAAGNLIFSYNTSTKKFASLSDGFGGTSTYGLWDAPLLAAGVRSWSYTLVAGADMSAAERSNVQSLEGLGSDSGSLLLGLNSPTLPLGGSSDAVRTTALAGSSKAFYQTIRTGTGDINISAGRDVRILNTLATIYTAGTQATAMANFDTPNTTYRATTNDLGAIQKPIYGAYYALGGGNVSIFAQNDIGHFLQSGTTLTADSSAELPVNWLYRRGQVDPVTGKFVAPSGLSGAPTQISSTSWWVDYSNFFEGVGALGGGNVTLAAGRDITNIDAVAPTNARMPKGTPDASALLELGGGDVTVQAGRNISGGVYYVERGNGKLSAGGDITTNSTRAAVLRSADRSDSSTWLPTTLFLGKGGFDIYAGGDLLLGSVVNVFMLPQGINNSYFNKSYFTTYATDDAVYVSSLKGSVTLKSDPNDDVGSLLNWFANVLYNDYPVKGSQSQTYAGYNQPWLRLVETDISQFSTAASLMPATLGVTSFSGDVNLIGTLTLSPSPTGTLSIYAEGSINGLQPNGLKTPALAASSSNPRVWSTATINVSDADPDSLPGVATPISLSTASSSTPDGLLTSFDSLFAESGSTEGNYAVLQTQQKLHDSGLLHRNDTEPLRLYADSGDISGITLYSPKSTQVIAGQDITDVALYLQNISSTDTSIVSAGRDLIAYDANSALRTQAATTGNELMNNGTSTAGPGNGNPTAGDIQIGGPGTLLVTAGRNIDLGYNAVNSDGTSTGITSIGNARNPALSSEGAAITVAAGLGGSQNPDYQAFEALFLNPSSANAARYLPVLADLLGLSSETNAEIWSAFNQLPEDQRNALCQAVFYTILRDAGRDHNDATSSGYGNYDTGFAAISALFPDSSEWSGNLSLSSREITTSEGGAINVLAPGGSVSLGLETASGTKAPPGIITERGGGISIFARDSVEIGNQRIFTLRGGDVLIWSSTGDIAAGNASKTVQSASPTRVLIDPQSGDVEIDLAGLATGGGIGVLAATSDVEAGSVDLIAPVGTIDAGDAGIRSTGNLNISALHVLNASNIQAAGTSTGVPVSASTTVSVPSSTTVTDSGQTAAELAQISRDRYGDTQAGNDIASLISVEVLGYGGGDSSNPEPSGKDTDKDEKDDSKTPRKKDAPPAAPGQLTQNTPKAVFATPST